MSLTKAFGLCGPGSQAQTHRGDDGRAVIFEPTPKRIRVRFGGRTIADSTRARLLHETGELPVYYFPEDDVDPEALADSDTFDHPLKGGGQRLDVRAGGKRAEGAARRWNQSNEGMEFLEGFVGFAFRKMDAWFEEDERVGVHPRDPYHRVDICRSSRHVRFLVGDTVVAESRRPRILFETSLPPRYYLPVDDVRLELLDSSTKTTQCPYKGEATYWSVTGDGERHEDLLWSYPAPLQEAAKVQDMLSVAQEQTPVTVEVDGEEL